MAPERDAPALEDVAHLLKARLRPEADLAPDVPLVARKVADDLAVVLSVDWPDEVVPVAPAVAASWPGGADAAWASAIRNTLADDGVAVVAHEHENGMRTWTCTGPSFFAASRILWPHRVVEGELPPEGLIAAAPNRHVGWLCPILDADVIAVVPWAAEWVAERFADGDGPISSDLYWWRAGAWTRLPVDVVAGEVRFAPPPAFAEALERLR